MPSFWAICHFALKQRPLTIFSKSVDFIIVFFECRRTPCPWFPYRNSAFPQSLDTSYFFPLCFRYATSTVWSVIPRSQAPKKTRSTLRNKTLTCIAITCKTVRELLRDTVKKGHFWVACLDLVGFISEIVEFVILIPISDSPPLVEVVWNMNLCVSCIGMNECDHQRISYGNRWKVLRAPSSGRTPYGRALGVSPRTSF